MDNEHLEHLSREELMDLVNIYSKNWLALDGLWFQSIERKYGMDEAMFHDVEVWKVYTAIEARRIRQFLRLPERPGLEGLRQAMNLRFNAHHNRHELCSRTLIRWSFEPPIAAYRKPAPARGCPIIPAYR